MSNNYDLSQVQSYSLKIKEIIEKIMDVMQNCVFKEYDDFSLHHHYGRFTYKNHSPKYGNLLLNAIPIEDHSRLLWECSLSPLDDDFKMQYFNVSSKPSDIVRIPSTDSSMLNYVDGYVYYKLFDEDMLRDEAFLFQQSLVLDEKSLFGICSLSWLNYYKLENINMICELDVDNANRIHKELFK